MNPRGGCNLEAMEPRRLLSAGDLDPTFGDAGVAALNLSSVNDNVSSMQQTTDGKIYVAGFGGGSSRLARLNHDGSLDATFGEGGIMTTSVPLSGTFAVSPDDGRIAVVSATATSDFFGSLKIYMFKANGSADTSFGEQGVVDADYASRNLDVQRPTHAVFLKGGNLLVTAEGNDDNGITTLPEDIHAISSIMQFARDGSETLTSLPYDSSVDAAERLSDGGVVLASHHYDSGEFYVTATQLELRHVLADGTMDEHFGVGGIAKVQDLAGDVNISFLGVGEGANASIVVVASQHTNGSEEPTVFHSFILNANGSAAAPAAVISPGADGSAVPLADGKVIFARSLLALPAWGATRVGSDGALDPTYGSAGQAALPPTSLVAPAVSVGIDGSVLFAFARGVDRGGQNGGDIVISRLKGGPTMRVNRRGTLTIGATLGDDVVRVYRRSRDGRIVVRVNDVARSYRARSIKRVVVYGYAGDDAITFGPGVRNGYIDGGAGDDSLAGGSRDDVLIGSSGADHIAGGDGRDASDDDVLDTRDSVERLLT